MHTCLLMIRINACIMMYNSLLDINSETVKLVWGEIFTPVSQCGKGIGPLNLLCPFLF